MANAYQLVSKNNKYSNLTDILSNEIANLIISSKGKNLNSFPSVNWTADMTVALASLKLYDQNNGTNLSLRPIKLWETWVRKNLMDDDGNLYTTYDNFSNRPDEKPKGSNFAYSIIFTSIFDREFSKELYKSFQKSFYKSLCGVEFAKEWKDGSNRVEIDSGPVVFGVGSVASAFSIGTAKANGDDARFESLSLSAELVTIPYETLNKKGYLANVSLGESVLLFTRTLRPWF
jgi:hypothetical protein